MIEKSLKIWNILGKICNIFVILSFWLFPFLKKKNIIYTVECWLSRTARWRWGFPKQMSSLHFFTFARLSQKYCVNISLVIQHLTDLLAILFTPYVQDYRWKVNLFSAISDSSISDQAFVALIDWARPSYLQQQQS